jgi:protease I
MAQQLAGKRIAFLATDTLTSFPSIRTDVRNAGGEWVDREVLVENGIVTSRKPDDLPAFCGKLVEEIAEGVHAERTVGAGTATT